MDSKSVLEYAGKHNAKILDLRFIDVPGVWQHVSYPIKELTAESFDDGFGMDASSIRGWAQIHESDMLLIPDPNTAFMDPFRDTPTLVMICDAQDPISRKPYDRDVRNLAHRAENYLIKSGVADQAFFGAEAEFFIFDSAVFDSKENTAFYKVDSDEGRWNSGRMEFPINSGKPEHNLGYRPRYKEGYFPVPPTDHYMDMRTDMVLQMQGVGIDVECHHHEVATAGQCEIDFRFDTLIKAADNMCKYKYVIRNVAQQYGKTATFMPKPIFSDNGSGMHTHQSLWNKGKPLFAGDLYAGLSQTALWYIGGLLKHAAAIVAFAAPSTNSYKRLVPGFEAPVNLAYSRRNRSAAVRIPMYSANPKAKRLEFRPPDPSCNPYLAYSAMLMAGLDGIENKIDPGGPLDQDIFELSKEELKHVPSVPGSLEESLKALHHDHAFLLKSGVFTKEFIDLWIDYKMSREVNPMRMRPHPFEFHLYYDI